MTNVMSTNLLAGELSYANDDCRLAASGANQQPVESESSLWPEHHFG
jgi:hypothetical protein